MNAEVERIRQKLFDAGWKPATYMMPVTDPVHKEIFAELYKAQLAVTDARIKEMKALGML